MQTTADLRSNGRAEVFHDQAHCAAFAELPALAADPPPWNTPGGDGAGRGPGEATRPCRLHRPYCYFPALTVASMISLRHLSMFP